MYDDSTLELAENKLLLLYIIKSIKYPISNAQLTDIILENSFINYFMLQQYISELISSEFLKYEEIDSKEFLVLTNKGDKVLFFFKDRISKNKLKLIDDYINAKVESIKKELNICSDYTIDENSSFLVNLKAMENGSVLMDLTISVPSKDEAKSLCSKWKNNSSDIYHKIINALISE
ncbi:DUF4364 family protein [Clostridium tarantellae]|uniref:DUF4364 family protein n=1 Tax=Clostridium tarantellae TaxID=39493 RepID=A0A6I1MIB8_9CLOT|nr:DUF4364 family protein [Clostridium tarantellae]MPQ42654.1 DUF4364 family protein [Clostridium tarantellae]